MELFGFEIKRRKEDNKRIQSFVEPQNDEGAIDVTATGGAVSSFLDMDGSAKSEAQAVQKYREMALHPEVMQAVDDIINEAVNITYDEKPIEVVTEDLDLPDNVKKKIREEFDNILKMLDFSNTGYDTFQKWYVDGRLNYHVVIDTKAPKKGIQELRYIDPRKLRKVREFKREKLDGLDSNNVSVKRVKNEYYIYNEKGFNHTSAWTSAGGDTSVKGLKIAKDSIVHCNSGLLNEKNTLVLSHLDKAYKPLNQLRMMEDAAVIYRISRAPERRIFYIDVGNLPKMKAEQYLRDMMTKHKNRLVYNATTGEIKDDRRHMSMTDDFWLPRREGGKGTEITTLPGGQNLGELDDILYFQKKLMKALNVPVSRLEPETGFSLGRASEITRDEVKFSKFIRRLRARFSILFDRILEKQLVLKGVIAPEEWSEIQNKIRYDFMIDNHFEELKNGEILTERLRLLQDIDSYRGEYFSKTWIQKNVLQMTEEDIETMGKELEEIDDASDKEAENASEPKETQNETLSANTNQFL